MIITPSFCSGIIPHEEYPRPQFKRSSYLCLNGKWDYAITKDEQMLSELCSEILVPFCPESKLSGVERQLKKDEFLHYKRKFVLEEGFNKGRVFINFGAVDQVATVYLNGKFVGRHLGGYLPFTFEITSQIKDGENELYVLVTDNADSDVYGRGKQKYKRGGIWYTATSGIWQSVWLESTPNEYLKRVKITPCLKDSTVKFEFEKVGNSLVSVVVKDGEEVVCSYDNICDNQLIARLSNPKLWTTDNPELYKVYFKCGEDEVESYFGMREFSSLDINGKKCFGLNGKPIFHNGLLDQGYFHDGIYTPKSNEVYYNEIKGIKDLGFNMLRKHIKIEPYLWYYYCDILGVLVWQDMINGGDKYSMMQIVLCPFLNLRLNDKNFKRRKRGNPRSRLFYYEEAVGLIDTHYNAVSICLWTPFNEAWGQFSAYETWRMLSQYDPTRLYDHASGWQDVGGGDLTSKHIYFRKLKMKNDGKRILALTEFGGYSHTVENHVFTDKKFGYKSFNDKNRLQKAYEGLYLNEVVPLVEDELLSATVYTQLSDVEDEVNGLYTYDRILKFDADKIKEINAKIYSAFSKAVDK